MASKLAVAGLIEGNFSEEGLAAMSDVQDMTSQMAKELMLGIRDNVEDIAAAFKKMAFENPDREVPEVPAKETSLPPDSRTAKPRVYSGAGRKAASPHGSAGTAESQTDEENAAGGKPAESI